MFLWMQNSVQSICGCQNENGACNNVIHHVIQDGRQKGQFYWEIKLLVVRVQELIRKFKKCFFSGRVKLKLSSGPYDFLGITDDHRTANIDIYTVCRA